MNRKMLSNRALAVSVIALVALCAAGSPAAPSRAHGLALPGVPGPGALAPADLMAAQATPGTATPTVAATAAASSTVAITATGAAASPTATATVATSASAAPTVAATLAATSTATVVATVVAAATASPAATATLAASPTAPPTPTVPLATSTAVMIITPIPAPAAATTADVQSYMTRVTPSLQYYNGPNSQYPFDWYLQRHLGNPDQFTMYRTEPRGVCNTYYYQYQGVYYCYTGGATAQVPDVMIPGMGIVPPNVFSPGAVPQGMGAGVVPGMTGGVVQTPSGYAVQSAWANVAPQQQYYYGPHYEYETNWYQQRHLTQPWLYQVYGYDPGAACGTYSYRYQDRYYCYNGGSVGGLPPAFAALPPGVQIDPTMAYSLQSYWGQVDPSNWYYYGADYQYDDTWYQQRHLANPLLYRPYGFEPVNECSTYYYRYQDQYYCYTGAYNYSTGDGNWSVPMRYWSQVDPTYRYYYGPDYQYDDAWYQQRHLANPSLFQPYNADPRSQCASYSYQYQGTYYCYVGD